jgi:PAS domain S-box-containing protein
MSLTTEVTKLYGQPSLHNILEEPEHAALLRMIKLVEQIFRLPVAYIALLGSDPTVVTRIGSGSAYWEHLRTYPLAAALREPILWSRTSETSVAGFNYGDLRFAASVPMRSSGGLELGVLVVADVQERPDFSSKDHETLSDLAAILAGKMELRMIAIEAMESEATIKKNEYLFRNIADSAPVMIIYGGVDGGCSFVNKAWLAFTGRTLGEELGDGYETTFHPDYREAVAQAYWDAVRERRPLTVQFPMRRNDGKFRWMEARGAPSFQTNGVYMGYIGCFVDITDQRPAILDFRLLRRALLPWRRRPAHSVNSRL